MKEYLFWLVVSGLALVLIYTQVYINYQANHTFFV